MISSTAVRVDRKVIRSDEKDSPRVERVGNVWHVRAVDLSRQVLREKDGSNQAGFLVEVGGKMQTMRPPILWMDGQEHREQRAKTARFFAPKTVDRRYRELMDTRSQQLVDDAVAAGEVVVDDMSLRYSVEVAAQVIGLTNSPVDGLAKRLTRLFQVEPVHPGGPAPSRFHAIRQTVTTLPAVGAFFLKDVRPAIKARKAEPQEDVITHLMGEGYTPQEILTECVTYGAAGMVTTREFITMCVWHLMRNDALRARYVVAGEVERYAILNEVLRLEPIVGHLYRRVQRDFTITDGDVVHELRAGDLVDFYIRQANADESVVGEQPLALCPGRELPRGIGAEVLSFGDGPHKCPGNSLAIQETDILLTKLLALDVEMIAEPTIGWDEVIAGYALRGLKLRVGQTAQASMS